MPASQDENYPSLMNKYIDIFIVSFLFVKSNVYYKGLITSRRDTAVLLSKLYYLYYIVLNVNKR